jgi:hypothetical protein
MRATAGKRHGHGFAVKALKALQGEFASFLAFLVMVETYSVDIPDILRMLKGSKWERKWQKRMHTLYKGLKPRIDRITLDKRLGFREEDMRFSSQLAEALGIPTPYEMHIDHGMVLSPTFITKGRKGVEAKGPRLFLSMVDDGWRIEVMIRGVGTTKKIIYDKKKAHKLARKFLGQLRSYGDDFVVSDGKRSWRVQGGDTQAFSGARQGVEAFFKRGV